MNMADKGFQSELLQEVSSKKKSPLPKIIVVLILAGIASFYLFYDSEPAKVVDIPTATTSVTKSGINPVDSTIQTTSKAQAIAKTPAAATPKDKAKAITKIIETPGSSARVIIAKFKKKKGSSNLKQIVESANEFKAKAMHTDAYLLYFFAARQGHNAAAQVLAKMHDPAFYSKQNSMLDQPDLVQAYKWYQQAARGGQTTAQKALDNFRIQVEQMAAKGNADAKQLSLQWQ